MRRVGKIQLGGIKKTIGGGALALTLALAAAAAYRTHDESDSEIFAKAYPQVSGTRLDGCEVCHSRVTAPPAGQQGGQAVVHNSCDSCHQATDYGRKKADVLTPFGIDYLKHGRDAAALEAIARLDSDGDGATNADELAALTNPGDAASSPEKPAAAHVILSYGELAKRLKARTQAMFVNVAKYKNGDSYSDVRGFRLIEVLEAAGVSKDAQSVDAISLDGYVTTFSIEQLRKTFPQAAPVFGLDKETLGECGWVSYGAKGLEAGKPLPPADILLSFEENGQPYPAASIDAEGRLVGSGPLRVAAPQMTSPGVPDLSANAAEACVQKVPEIHRYHREYEKNADYCAKAVVALRVNPLPPGVVDIDWPKYAKQAVESKSVVVFGAITAR